MTAPETTNGDYSHLLPKRHPEQELFVCDVADAFLKDIMQHMEHPFYSLSKKPDTAIRRYEHNDQWLEVTPSVKGLATIYDKDILIYAVSQIIAKLKQGHPVSKRMRITARDFLVFSNRGTTGPEYDALEATIDRLAGTRIGTNIRTNGEERYDNFGLIDRGHVRRTERGKNGKRGRMLWCEITLSDWLFNAIEANEVLTLHPDYFRLRKPLERRVYELARKHCGPQQQWSISVAKLLHKSGSRSTLKRFRQMLKMIVANNHLPDYRVTLEDDIATFHNRNTMPANKPSSTPATQLSPNVYQEARQAAPGWDVYLLEQEWRAWANGLSRQAKNADEAYVGFCKKRFEEHGRPG